MSETPNYWTPSKEELEKKISEGLLRRLTLQEKKEYLGLGEDQKVNKPKNQEREGSVSLEKAFEIMGDKNFMGPQQVENAFGIQLKPEQIPAITFSEQELTRARELDQILILRVESIDGKKLTMNELNKLIQDRLAKKNLAESKLLYNTDWYKDEVLFKFLNVKVSWVLTTKSIIGEGPESSITDNLPDGSQKPRYQTTSKNYLDQTETIIQYLTEQVFKNQIPKEYQKAIDEFYTEKAEIQKLMSTSWQQAATKLKDLKITQLTRREAVETTYDLAVYLLNTNEYLLKGRYDWGKSQSSDSRLVNVGDFDSEGAGVSRRTPDDSIDYLGVSLSRTSLVYPQN